MVSRQSVDEQLNHIGFKSTLWSGAEVQELPSIIMPDEEIYECVSGTYEGGFALLIASNFRVLLIDKKPLNFLTVEDLRFDMINEIDYSHRLMGANITISTGSKTLRFRSYNQKRLRKLITHVQDYMAQSKNKQSQHVEGQSQHLEKLNEQLQTYLVAQQRHQEQLTKQLDEARVSGTAVVEPEAPKPDPQLADYLFAQSLLREYEQQQSPNTMAVPAVAIVPTQPQQPIYAAPVPGATSVVTEGPGASRDSQLQDLYAEGMQEVFGKHQQAQVQASPAQPQPVQQPAVAPIDANALRIAYSKLPMALRNRKFGRPSFHAHSQAVPSVASAPQQVQPLLPTQ